MREIITKVYQFEELSDEAKKTAIDHYRDLNVDFADWHESVYNDAIDVAKLMGIDIDKIYFSGFSSQGDGACFEGSYRYAKGSVKEIKAYAPKDTELHGIAERLQAIQKKNFYGLLAYITHSGHYYHSGCTSTTVEHNTGASASDETKDEVKELMRDFMDWIYNQLENEYTYQTSDEQVIDGIIANEYEFTAEGRQWK